MSELEPATIIEVDPATPNRKLAGTIRDRVGRTITVLTCEEVAASVAVWVQTKHLLSLGQVVRSVPSGDAMWTIYVGVERTMLVV